MITDMMLLFTVFITMTTRMFMLKPNILRMGLRSMWSEGRHGT